MCIMLFVFAVVEVSSNERSFRPQVSETRRSHGAADQQSSFAGRKDLQTLSRKHEDSPEPQGLTDEEHMMRNVGSIGRSCLVGSSSPSPESVPLFRPDIVVQPRFHMSSGSCVWTSGEYNSCESTGSGALGYSICRPEHCASIFHDAGASGLPMSVAPSVTSMSYLLTWLTRSPPSIPNYRPEGQAF